MDEGEESSGPVVPAPGEPSPRIQVDAPTASKSDLAEWDLTGWLGYNPTGLEGSLASASPSAVISSKTSRKRLVVGALTVVILAVAITVGVATTRDGAPVPGAGIAPAAFVVSSTQETLAQRTADITISGIISAKGHQVPLQGTGTANFDTNAFSATVNATEGSGNFVERELVAGGRFYMGMTVNGQDLSQLTGGPHWIDVPVPDQNSSSLGTSNVDPLQQLQTLESKGAKVVPLGTSQIDGDTVSGYAVTPSRASELQAVEKEIQSGQIPQSVASQMMRAAQALAGFTLDVYFDNNHLMRRMSFQLSEGGTRSFTGTLDMTFSNYGTSVSIAPPSQSDVVSFDQFVKDAQAAGATQ